MKTDVTLTCDRCGNTVIGIIIELEGNLPKVTGGFYDVTGTGWSEFRRGDEKNVCDFCMWDDPKYIAIYGDVRSKQVTPSK